MTVPTERELLQYALNQMQMMHACEADEREVKDCMQQIDAHLAEPARGTVEVPVEPTEAMLGAGYAAMMNRKALSDVYSAMLAARNG